MSETEWPTECGSTENPLGRYVPYSLANSDHTTVPNERETTMAYEFYRPNPNGDGIDWFPTETIRPMDHLSVDPNNPNSDVDGRDFLYWQRGNVTDDGLLLPAVQKTDNGLLLPAVTDGTSNTIMFGEVVKPSLPAGDEVLVVFEFGDKGVDYSGSHVLYQDINIPAHTGGVNAVFCDGSVRPADPITFTYTVNNTSADDGSVAMETLTIAHEGFLLI